MTFERCCELGLAEEARAELLVGGERGGDHLQRDLAGQACVRRQVDGAHPAAAEHRLDPIAAERLADGGSQSVGHVRIR